MPFSYSGLGASSVPIPEHLSPVMCWELLFLRDFNSCGWTRRCHEEDQRGQAQTASKKDVASIHLLVVRIVRAPVWCHFLPTKHDAALFLSRQSPLRMISFPTCDGVDNGAQNCRWLNQFLQYVRFCCQWKTIV